MTARYTFGLFDFDPSSGELRREGIGVRLQPQPARVLAQLLSRAGQVVSRDDLRTAIWSEGTHVDFERGLNFCIAQIRSALGDSSESPRFIETLPKRGYRFIAPVRRQQQPSVGPEKPGTAEPAPAGDPQQRPAVPDSPVARSRWSRAWIAAGVLLAIAALGAVYAARSPDSGRVRVAVVPFDNETGDGTYTDLAQSVSDATVARLAAPERVIRLAVIGNSATLRRPRGFRDLKAIGADVGAEYVVLAQVKRDESRVRLIAHLIRVEDEAHVWAETFDRPAFTLEAQAEIAEAIAAAVTRQLSGG